MTHDFFIRSYRNDFPWLKYLLKSIVKYSSGFRDVVIVVPEHDKAELDKLNLTREKVFYVNETGGDGYLFQQLSKINADFYSNADVLFFVDSDCCLTKPIKPSDFFRGGLPIMLITPYSVLPKEVPWQAITEKALKFPCKFETMRRLPIVFPGWLLPRFRSWFRDQHGITIDQYVVKQPHRAFSEFNAIGSWAMRHHHEKLFWWDTTGELGVPEPVLTQGWSWGGLTPEIEKKLEEITS